MADQIDYFTKQQEKREIEISSSLKKCNIARNFKDVNDIKAHLLKQELESRFYSAELMSALFCIFDVILYMPTDNGNFIEASNSINNIFDELRRIGSESVEGYALMASFNKENALFVIKVPRDPENDKLFHEYFVGLACTNNLRSLVPNYAYILGAFKCNPPKVLQDKSVEQFCTKGKYDSYVNYVIYEKINGKSLRDSAGDITLFDLLSYIIQLCLAIQTGADSCGFTHYDLHDENVILRPWLKDGQEQTMFYIPYENRIGDTWYVKTNKVATMIDFGRSRVEIDGESFGVYGFENYGVFVDVARPFYDLYKILMFTLFSMLVAKNEDVVEQAMPLVQLITDKKFEMTADEVYNQIVEENKTYYELSPDVTVEEKITNLWDYLDDVKETFPGLWKQIVHDKAHNNIPILECSEFCPTKQQAVDTFTNNNMQNIITKTRKYDGTSVVSRDLAATAYTTASALQQELLTMKNNITAKVQELSDLSTMGLPNHVNKFEFDGFVQSYIEPHMHLKEQLKDYRQKLALLKTYNTRTEQNFDMSVYDIELNEWQQNYSLTLNKFGKMFVPAETVNMKNYIMELMSNSN